MQTRAPVAVRAASKRWYCVPSANASVLYRRLDEVWGSYANLVDYFRLVASFLIIVFAELEMPWWAGTMLIGSYLLDWVDGPLARAYDQCSSLGASLDWLADILTNVGQVFWWSKLGPRSALWFGWPFLFIEITYMMLDTICYAQGKYPALYTEDASQSVKVNRVLSWSLRPGTHGSLYMYTDFYALVWFVFPVTTTSLCIQWSYGHEVFNGGGGGGFLMTLVDLWLVAAWTVGVVLSAIFILTDGSLAQLLFLSWFEDRSKKHCGQHQLYCDLESHRNGGCTVVESDAIERLLNPCITGTRRNIPETILRDVTETMERLCPLPDEKKSQRTSSNRVARVVTRAELAAVIASACGPADSSTGFAPLKHALFISPVANSTGGAALFPVSYVHVPLESGCKGGLVVRPTSSKGGAAAAPPLIVRYVPTTLIRVDSESMSAKDVDDAAYAILIVPCA